MLKIGDFSKLSRISIRMLRHYDEIGLLAPDNTDGFTGYRYYSEAQLPVAGRINALKDMGFGLSAISDILQNCDDPETLRRYLVLKRSEVLDQAEEAGRRLLLLDTTITRLGKDGNTMNHNVTLKQLPERYVASVRRIISSYDQEGLLWQTLMGETQGMKLQDTNPCYAVAIFHDDEFKENDVDVEVQKSVSGSYRDTEHVTFKTVAPVQIASATYKGGYDQISGVNEAVANWIRDNGYEMNGSPFNIYHVSPHETQNPADWVTEVCYPVTKKA